MGMYTELVLKCSIKENLPKEVIQILNYLFNSADEELPTNLPNHPVFTKDRWKFLGKGNSYNHITWATSKYKDDYLFTRSDIKNYDSEIEEFISWITPYIDEQSGECIGWTWYEEENSPTLLYKP